MKSTEAAKDHANRVIALEWVTEEQRSLIEGAFLAGFTMNQFEYGDANPDLIPYTMYLTGYTKEQAEKQYANWVRNIKKVNL